MSFLYKDLLNKHNFSTFLQTRAYISNMPSLLHIKMEIPKDRDLVTSQPIITNRIFEI